MATTCYRHDRRRHGLISKHMRVIITWHRVLRFNAWSHKDRKDLPCMRLPELHTWIHTFVDVATARFEKGTAFHEFTRVLSSHLYQRRIGCF